MFFVFCVVNQAAEQVPVDLSKDKEGSAEGSGSEGESEGEQYEERPVT